MKTIKYLLIAAVIFTLWVTSPIWMPRSKYSHNTTPTEIDTFMTEQKKERNVLLKAQDKELAELEEKFGLKSSVMQSLEVYWQKKHTDTFELLKCSSIRPGITGWSIVCSYRLKSQIIQDTYTINKGKVSQ